MDQRTAAATRSFFSKSAGKKMLTKSANSYSEVVEGALLSDRGSRWRFCLACIPRGLCSPTRCQPPKDAALFSTPWSLIVARNCVRYFGVGKPGCFCIGRQVKRGSLLAFAAHLEKSNFRMQETHWTQCNLHFIFLYLKFMNEYEVSLVQVELWRHPNSVTRMPLHQASLATRRCSV